MAVLSGALALSCLATSSHAAIPDMIGTGALSMGAGGGGVAIAGDGAAARLNPAGLNRIERPTIAIGLSSAMHDFYPSPDLWWDTNRDGLIDYKDDPLVYDVNPEPALGLHLHGGRNVGGKFGIGLAAYVPVDRLLSFGTFEPELPNYFLYGHRHQRFNFALGVGGEVFKGIAVGAAVDVLAAARFDLVATLDAQVIAEGGGDAGLEDVVGDVVVDVHELDLDVVPDFAPIIGIQWDVGQAVPPLHGLWLGASWRGSAGLLITADLDVQANIAAEDIGDLEPFVFSALIDGGLEIYDHYVPGQGAIGAAYRLEDTLDLYVDARYTHWKPMILNAARIADVDITSPLIDIDDIVRDGNDHQVVLRSTWGVHSGLSLELPRFEVGKGIRYLQLTMRGGFGFEPSPLFDQGKSSALLDADRTMYTLGAGVEHFDPFQLVDGPVRYDLFFQLHQLATGVLPRSTPVPAAGYPRGADSISVGGRILMFGLEWSFDY